MKTLAVYKNISLHDFLNKRNEIKSIDHLVPNKPGGASEILLCLADVISSNGFAIGMEIQIDGLQRPKRIPLVVSRSNEVYIAKYSPHSSKMEQAIMVLEDLVNEVKQDVGSKFNVYGLLIHNVNTSIHSRISHLANSLDIALVHKDDIDGLFN